jgi:2',3'-cyclic-nucleotide 2'-phosphodiesterase (5'-nucleotidase family)
VAAFVYVDPAEPFPDQDGRTDLAAFMYQSLRDQDPAAVGVGPRDLRHGVQFLQSLVRETKLPVLCANLVDRSTGKRLFPATRVVTVRGVKVGLFALIGEHWDLGPARDSLAVTDAENAAHEAWRRCAPKVRR